MKIELPRFDTNFRDRHVLIVVRGIGYKHDLDVLRRGGYLNDVKPVLVGVDGGADALLELGHRPDIIIGDFDSVSEEALACGADLVHHVHPDGRVDYGHRAFAAILRTGPLPWRLVGRLITSREPFPLRMEEVLDRVGEVNSRLDRSDLTSRPGGHRTLMLVMLVMLVHISS